MQPNTDPSYLSSQGLSPTFTRRFLNKLDFSNPNGCWVFKGYIHPSGHGRIKRGHKLGTISPHQAAWIVFRGPIPKGKCVLHNCPNKHNPACCNPDHLKLGDRNINSHDAVKEGMAGGPILTWAMVDAIRTSKLSVKAMSDKYGVCQSNIYLILANKTWRIEFHP